MTDFPDNVRSLAAVPHGRVPPQSLDAERSVLGGILLDNAAFDDVVTIVAPADFYREAHRKVFEAMIALSTKAEPIDRVTLKSELVAMGALEHVGGEDFLDLLDKLVPSASNLGYYANIVHEKGLARRAIEAAHAIATEGYEQHGEVLEFIERAEARIYALRGLDTRHDVAQMRDLVTAEIKRIEARCAHKNEVTGAPTGIRALDLMTTGFQPGQLVYIGARPSMGKTAFMLDSARATCRVPGDAALVLSLEMPKEDLVDRLLAAESGVNLHRLRIGSLENEHWSRLVAPQQRLREMELHINDSARTTLDVRAVARRTARKLAGEGKRLRIVFVDYLQLLRPVKAYEQRDRELGEMSRDLKTLAKELAIPVVALAVLNRALEKRPDKRPILSDLRESGSLEFDADVVLFLYRDEVYNPETEDKGIAEIIIGKQRNGPVGTVKAAWSRESTTFRDVPDASAGQRSFDDVPLPESENP